ncbi:MAG TPA: lysylphosphatidylglycerol synthase transmembrane domain-containing protein [Solirubrobacteraceae bacterium]
MQEDDQAVITERNAASLAADPEPLPNGVSSHRLRRGLLRLGGVVAIAVAVVTLAPGLGNLRSRFANARPAWIVVACAFEVLSVLAYVPAFRAVFCKRMSWATSYKIGVAEEGAGSLFPLGGAGSLALGVWALRRGGMPAEEIARKTVAFYLLTSAPSVAMLFLLGVGLATGVLPGHGGFLLTVVPAVVAAGAVAAALALRRLARGAKARITRQGERSRWVRLAPALSATSDGVEEALRQLRQANPLLLVGLAGFLVFDQLAFWAAFRAVGASPELALIWMAYLIGQLGNWLPVPGGIGGVELGLVGVLVLYGLPALTATAAVLLYRVIELWIPAVLGITAFVQLRLLLRRETEAIKLCKPGDVIEIVGLGPATINRSGGDIDREHLART